MNVQDEIKRLRIANRILLALFLVALVVPYVLIQGTRTPDVDTVLRARALEILDDHGHVRAEVSLDGGGPGIALFDHDGNPVASMTAYAEEPGVTLYRNGNRVAGLAAANDASALVLFDAEGRARAVVGVNEDGPVVETFDANGNPVEPGTG